MPGSRRFVCGRRVVRRCAVGGVMMMGSRRIAIIMMLLSRRCALQRTMMFYLSARRSNAGGKPLQRQRGHQQPEQKCLEEATHCVSLPFRPAFFLQARSQYGPCHGGKVKRFALIGAPDKMPPASLRRLAVQIVLSAPARLARDRYAHFVRRSWECYCSVVGKNSLGTTGCLSPAGSGLEM
jgi:hypothetical protein